MFLIHPETNLTNTIFNILSNLPSLKPPMPPLEPPRIIPNPIYLCPKLPVQTLSTPPPLPSGNGRLDSFIGLLFQCLVLCCYISFIVPANVACPHCSFWHSFLSSCFMGLRLLFNFNSKHEFWLTVYCILWNIFVIAKGKKTHSAFQLGFLEMFIINHLKAFSTHE